jgi:hypothetical protein
MDSHQSEFSRIRTSDHWRGEPTLSVRSWRATGTFRAPPDQGTLCALVLDVEQLLQTGKAKLSSVRRSLRGLRNAAPGSALIFTGVMQALGQAPGTGPETRRSRRSDG